MLYKKYKKGTKKVSKYANGIQKVTVPGGAEDATGLEGVGGMVDQLSGTTAMPYGAMGDVGGQFLQNKLANNKPGSVQDAHAYQGKVAMQAAGAVAPVALNPAVLGATYGLSSLAVPVAAGAAYLGSASKAKGIEREQLFASNANENVDKQLAFTGQESNYIEPQTTNTFGRTLYGDMAPKPIYAEHGVTMERGNQGHEEYSLTADFAGPTHAEGGIKYTAPVKSNSGTILKPIEVEGGEIEVKNSKGDISIIPKAKAARARDFLKQGNDLAMETLIDSLPTEDEAQKGNQIYAANGVQGIGDNYLSYLQATNPQQQQYQVPSVEGRLRNFANNNQGLNQTQTANALREAGLERSAYDYLKGQGADVGTDYSANFFGPKTYAAFGEAFGGQHPQPIGATPGINDLAQPVGARVGPPVGPQGPQPDPVTGQAPLASSAARSGGRGNAGEIAATIGSAAPTIYNLSKGLFGESEVYDPNYVDLETPQYRDMSDPSRARVKGSVAVGAEATSNYAYNAADAGQNQLMGKFAGDELLNQIDLGELGRYDQVQAQGTQIRNQKALINRAAEESAEVKTLTAAENKLNYLEAGIGGVGTLSDDLYSRSLVKSRDAKAYEQQETSMGALREAFPFLYES